MSSGAVFVSAGEVSGDHYVAEVTRCLRSRGFDGAIRGLCGEEARAAGVECLWGAERLQIMGVSEAIGSLRDILRIKREMQREILSSRPDALILVDSPDYNLPVTRAVRRAGYAGRVLYISPPSVWAWRSYRVKALRRDIDENLPLFKFEHDYLLSAGCDSRWIGHPFVGEFASYRPDRGRVLRAVRGGRVPRGKKLVALLPGSRRSEISMLFPILADVYRALEEAGRCPVFSVAPGLSPAAAEVLLSMLRAGRMRFYRGPGRDLMAVSDAVCGSSGTATAQALLLRRFMVVMYKVRPLSAMIGRLFLRNLFFAVPNLLAGRMFYPELIQNAADAGAAARALIDWLDAPREARERDEAEMERLASLMGEPGACAFWAERVIDAFRADSGRGA